MSGLTPSQTLGPFFQQALRLPDGERLVTPATRGERIVVEGSVRDGAGVALPDALIETWQANSFGRYRHAEDTQDKPEDPAFDGFGRLTTSADGSFTLQTVKPGSVAGPDGRPQAPHLLIAVFGRGILTPLVTRAYFEDEPSNATDPILALVPAARRATLLARRRAPGRYRFEIVLQGENETVFFDV